MLLNFASAAVAVALALVSLPTPAATGRVLVQGQGGQPPATGQMLQLELNLPARTDAGNRTPAPAVWVDALPDNFERDPSAACIQLLQRLARGERLSAPVRDFNMLHVVTLGQDGTVHVLDARGGIRGARSVARLSLAERPGDWVYDRHSARLWVALPDSARVAEINPASWRVVARHRLEAAPSRLAVDAEGHVYVVAGGRIQRWHAERGFAPAATLPVLSSAVDAWVPGAGGRWLALGPDRSALIEPGGTAIPIGLTAQAALHMPLAAGYALIDRQGQWHWLADDGALFSIAAPPLAGTRVPTLKASADGQFVFAYRTDGDGVAVLDVASRRIVRHMAVPKPAALVSSENFVYVRSSARGELLVMPTVDLAAPSAQSSGRWISAGEAAQAGEGGLVVSTSGAAFWIDAVSNVVFAYHEGMNVASGTLRHPGAAPERLMLYGPMVESLGEGRFASSFSLETPGQYVAAYLGVGGSNQGCERFAVQGPDLSARAARTRVRVVAVDPPLFAPVGQTVSVRLRLHGERSAPPALGLIWMSADGTWQRRAEAVKLSGADPSSSEYSVDLVAPRPGAFLLMLDRSGDAVAAQHLFAMEAKP